MNLGVTSFLYFFGSDSSLVKIKSSVLSKLDEYVANTGISPRADGTGGLAVIVKRCVAQLSQYMLCLNSPEDWALPIRLVPSAAHSLRIVSTHTRRSGILSDYGHY